MSENEFNANQQRAYRKKPQQKPKGMSDEDWQRQVYMTQNRHHVGAKLTEVNWTIFRAWCIKEKLNFNSGINRLIATHPEIND